MLPSSEITAMKTEAALAMPDSGQIYRRAIVSDSAGGHTVSETLTATLACRVSPPDRRAIEVYAQRIGTRQAFTIDFPGGSDVRVGDRALISSVSYEIIAILDLSWEITHQVIGAVQG